MTRSDSRLRRLLSNLGNLVISIVLAILVWIVAVQETNPNIEKLYPTPLPIVEQNQPAGMLVYGESARQVRVTLSGPQSAWDVLTPDRLAATVDLSQQVSGTLELPVHVTVADRTFRVVKVEPSVISLKIEPLAEKSVPVNVSVVGEPALGYAASPIVTQPATVLLRGPSSLVQQVASASGQVSIQDVRTSISQTLQLTPRDADGQTVPIVTLTPSMTLASVAIRQLGGFRDLAVKIDLRDNVAPGYLIGNVSVNPQIVTVFGSPSTLDALPGFISTEPVSVTNATQDIEERIRLDLPSGVSILGDPFVQVSVKVNAIESSITVQRPLQPQGLQPDMMARLSPETVDVIISGPIPRLDSLRADDVVVVLNLLNLDVGTHQVEPDVSVPNGLTVVSVNPATVQVIVGPIITPTELISGTTVITSGLPITFTSPVPSPTPIR
jgi:YbbR domain-containing protein